MLDHELLYGSSHQRRHWEGLSYGSKREHAGDIHDEEGSEPMTGRR